VAELEGQRLDFQSVKLNSGMQPRRVCLERKKLGDELFLQRSVITRVSGGGFCPGFSAPLAIRFARVLASIDERFIEFETKLRELLAQYGYNLQNVIDRTLKKMRDAAASHVHILENEVFVWQQIRFLGTTAWTDFTSSGDVVAATALARDSMNDFRVIRADASYRRLRPDDVAGRNRVARGWLTQELDKPFQGKTVVVTHHAPTPHVLGDKQEGHLSAAYANSWPELIEKADLWVFGHTHRDVDEELAGCRVVSNPRGYPSEDTGFQPGFEVQI
jgi:hypothetical protein